jgi:hypothetical protein
MPPLQVTQLRVLVSVLDVNDNAPEFSFTIKEQEVPEVSQWSPVWCCLGTGWAQVLGWGRGAHHGNPSMEAISLASKMKRHLGVSLSSGHQSELCGHS